MTELTNRPIPTIDDIGKKVRETIHEDWHPEKPADYPCYYCRLWAEYKRHACFYCIHNPDCGMYPLRQETMMPSPLDHEAPKEIEAEVVAEPVVIEGEVIPVASE